MAASLSVALATIAATLTHISVRRASGARRGTLFCIAMALLAVSFIPGEVFGGFWPGVYTLLSIYFLVCMVPPWIAYWMEQRRVG